MLVIFSCLKIGNFMPDTNDFKRYTRMIEENTRAMKDLHHLLETLNDNLVQLGYLIKEDQDGRP